MRSFTPIAAGLALCFGITAASLHDVHHKQRRNPQDYNNINYDLSGVDWSKVNFGGDATQPAPAPAPAPAPVTPDPTTAQPPAVEQAVNNGGATGATDGDMTISITNKHGCDLALTFDSNAGAPGFRGNPTETTLATAATTSYAVPAGWAGRINVGKMAHSDNSKIEGSFYGSGNGDIDISYVDGYSVPIVCSAGGKVFTGCNMELFSQDCSAPNTPQMGSDGQVALCQNGARPLNDGPPTSFFAACAGAAYTFPNDNLANVGMMAETQIDCCVGTSCDKSEQQKAKEQKKRDVKSPRANAPSLLARSHKLHHATHASKQ